MKNAAAFMVFLLFLPALARADDRSTECRMFASTITCDDGTDYRIFNGSIYGPDGELYMPSKNPAGNDDKTMDGDYSTTDGTKIRVQNGMVKVEYSQRILRERKEREKRRKRQEEEFDTSLGRNDPVKVDENGFFE